MGKFDVYYTSLFYGERDSPLPMPEPINSSEDDFAFVAEDNLQTGYFSRRSASNDDIWRFRSTIIRKAACDTLRKTPYTYEFYDENALRYDTMPSPMKFTWYFGDGATAQGKRVEHTFKAPGKYSVRLEVMNLLTNQVEPNQEKFDLEITDPEQPYISAPNICDPGQQVKMNADSTNLPGWSIVQYYWNFGDETIGIGKDVSKSYLRPGIYNIQLIVTAAPDADGLVREACVSKNITVTRKQ
jgi:PKD repeat protein